VYARVWVCDGEECENEVVGHVAKLALLCMRCVCA